MSVFHRATSICCCAPKNVFHIKYLKSFFLYSYSPQVVLFHHPYLLKVNQRTELKFTHFSFVRLNYTRFLAINIWGYITITYCHDWVCWNFAFCCRESPFYCLLRLLYVSCCAPCGDSLGVIYSCPHHFHCQKMSLNLEREIFLQLAYMYM